MIQFSLLLKLFWSFFVIALFTIGGGQAMIPLIESTVVGNGWLTFEEFQNFVTVSESTPGPIVVNIATFVGQSQLSEYGVVWGFIGSIVATIGVILPSFIIILIVAKVLEKFLNNRFVGYALKGIRPFIVGIIVAAACKFFYVSAEIAGNDILTIDYKAIFIMVCALIMLRFKKLSHPIIIIVISAVLGIILYGVF